ncbi:major facilitator superfamily domain-containing protein [Lasiosphaeria miniovina]|uniref:Major facilitator superfamily domain-containing protein n=1 Tax=Lasiosphaeria miniovina TaxID=1954250 RepID=A0AA40DFS5_9PEZI|nr:major facilitator superfamily domain-containing protein [Lasiosphaeria miniovina]KAK0701824.1 major facilitator superfamily domain-containing protein [Lasiosphaeria miniovina]
MTLARRRPRDPDEFPTIQLFILAIVRLAEPIALTSIFPYAWPLIKRFKIGDENDASFYAGLLVSSFALAEALMGMYWGASQTESAASPMIMVGFATNIWVALLGRAIGGLLNGNIGVIQTMVGELVTKSEHEPRAYSIMPFVWSIGTIIGPFIGGTFADPHDAFPNVFPKGSLFEMYPYLLPNLICAGLLLVSILLGYFLLEETHPDMQPRVMLPDDTFQSENTPLIGTSDALKRPAVDLRDDNYGSMRGRGSSGGKAWAKETEKRPTGSVFSKRIMAVIVSLSIFTYHSMTFDHLLPIFFEDDRAPQDSFHDAVSHPSPFYSPGGLGLSLQAVGMVMAVQGAIALFMQAAVFPIMAERLGVYRLFIFITVFHPIAYIIVPYLLQVPESLLYPAIYVILAVRNFFSILLYPLLLIFIKEATPSPTILGKVNGLAASAGAAFRMIAPPIAGYLYTVGRKMDCTALAWYGSAIVAVIGSVQCFWVIRDKNHERLSSDDGIRSTAAEEAPLLACPP